MKLKIISSLEKVFPDSDDSLTETTYGSSLLNELHSFVIAVKCEEPNWGRVSIDLVVTSDPPLDICVKKVGLVPCELPCYEVNDPLYLRTAPGLYPDVLLPLDQEVFIIPNRWESFWVQLNSPKQARPGRYHISISAGAGKDCARAEYTLDVFNIQLPPQSFIFTQWLHTDCIATYHRVPVFSEEHWTLVEQYIAKAAQYGVNMILTPLVTPPLDVQVGGERLTVQLVDIEKHGEQYRFGFDKLKRWVSLCRRNGIRYFEIGHLFTQWGAKHAPKVVVRVDGNDTSLFGWHTNSTDKEYRGFLQQLLEALLRFIRENSLQDSCYFHVSDEPQAEHLDSYKQAVQVLRGSLGDLPIIDALSDYTFYEQGLVKEPVVAINHIQPFLDHQVERLWAYYCCSQHEKVSNRFIAMPSLRNRILGIQLYYYQIKGFLHWGYNFYHTQYSQKAIDPYAVTDAGGAFPSGDAFSVYPTEDGCTESLRMVVFYEAIQDMQALALLEGFIGRESVQGLIVDSFGNDFGFEEYPQNSAVLLKFREQVNQRICKEANRERL